jgi:hypothetical protein
VAALADGLRPAMIKQFDAAAVQQRQQADIETDLVLREGSEAMRFLRNASRGHSPPQRSPQMRVMRSVFRGAATDRRRDEQCLG